MSAHTPGPWKVELSDKGSPEAIVRGNGEPSVSCNCNECLESGCSFDGYHRIVTTDSHVYGPSLQDAHLIAAAPELLAALKGFLKHAADQGWWLQGHAFAVMNIARAAIAKAEGRQ